MWKLRDAPSLNTVCDIGSGGMAVPDDAGALLSLLCRPLYGRGKVHIGVQVWPQFYWQEVAPVRSGNLGSPPIHLHVFAPLESCRIDRCWKDSTHSLHVQVCVYVPAVNERPAVLAGKFW